MLLDKELRKLCDPGTGWEGQCREEEVAQGRRAGCWGPWRDDVRDPESHSCNLSHVPSHYPHWTDGDTEAQREGTGVRF